MIADTLARYRDMVTGYVDDVREGRRPVGKYERLAVARFEYDLACAGARHYRYDWDEALRAIAFFPGCLRHVRGELADAAFELSPYQAFTIAQLFGWQNVQDGCRRFNRLYLSIGAGNGKTTLLAGIILRVFFREPHRMADFFCTAPTKDQSLILYETCREFIETSPILRQYAEISDSKSKPQIKHKSKRSVLRPKGVGPTAGFDVIVMGLDEVHEWRTDRQLRFYDELRARQRSQTDPFCLAITTAGDPSGASPLWEVEESYCERVLESYADETPVDDGYLGLIYRIDEKDDPFDIDCLHKANPNMHLGSPREEIIRICQNEARHRPDSKHRLLRAHCNRPTTNESALMDDIEAWQAAGRSEEILRDAEPDVFCGLDMGENYDFAALAWLQTLAEPNHYLLRQHSWTCAENPHVDVLREPFLSWQQQGWLTVFPGDSVDFEAIVTESAALLDDLTVRHFNFDIKNARVVVAELGKVLHVEPEHFQQNHASYNESTKQFVDRTKKQSLVHLHADGCLSYQVRNLTINRHPTNGYWMPNRSNRRRKIDAGVAALMALAAALYHESPVCDYYETHRLQAF